MSHVDHGANGANGMSMSGSRRTSSGAAKPTGPLHRIPEVMEQERMSERAAALRMNMTVAQIRAEVQPSSDLPLTALYRWQAALNVPVADMLREPDMKLSPALQHRASLLKAMRTVRSILERSHCDAIQALGKQLAQQLTDLMPELKLVTAWPTYGQRRRMDEPGAIVDKQLPDDFFSEWSSGE